MGNRFVYESGFAPVPYAAMRDENISIGARGLLALMMTHSSEWTFNRNDMIKKCACGKEKYDRMRRELIDAGYLEIKKAHDAQGRWQGYDWHIYPTPDKSIPENPDTLPDNRPPENPTVGKTEVRETRPHKDKQDKGKTNIKDKQGGVASDPPAKKPDIDWSKADKKAGSLAIMEKDQKYALPTPFYIGAELKDYALIDKRFELQEFNNIIAEMVDYWRDQAKTKKGKKTASGWKRTFKSWLDRKAIDYKTRYRDKPFDHRSGNETEDSAGVDVESLPLDYWRGCVRRFADQGDWSGMGPPPGDEGCLAPADILKENGFGIEK